MTDIFVSIANMMMRGASLGARFALSIYMAHWLGYRDLGTFGLLSGLAGVMPAILGFGVSFHVNRELLLRPRADAYRLLRDRLMMSAAFAGLVWCAVLAVAAMGMISLSPETAIGVAIVTLELVAFDLHIGLLNLRRPVAANFLLFIRSASWIFPVVGLGLLMPEMRSIEMLLYCWLAALLLSFLLLFVVIRDASIMALLREPVDWLALRGWMTRTPLIYANDLATTGQTYLDRFIVAQILGIGAAGIYTLYFSITQGIYVLIASAVTQMSPARIMAVRDEPGLVQWATTIRGEAMKALMTGVPVVLLVALFTLVILPAFGFGNFRDWPALFGLMTLAAMLKPIADLGNVGLYSLNADRALALINIAGVLLSIVAGLICLSLFGLVGIGLSALGVQCALILLRAKLLRARLRLARMTSGNGA